MTSLIGKWVHPSSVPFDVCVEECLFLLVKLSHG